MFAKLGTLIAVASLASMVAYGQGGSVSPSGPAVDPLPVDRPAKGPEPIGFVPLPVYATLPNEGATYGFMPVFLGNNEKGEVVNINAPSVTWNDVSHVTFTGRYFQFPNNFEERLFQVTYATRLYREVIADWNRVPVNQGNITHNLSFQYRSDPYRRFYGFGKDSGPSDETSYTLRSIRTMARAGYNFFDGVNLNATVGFNHYEVLREGVLGLKNPFDEFPGTPGLGGSNTIYTLGGLRFDTRPQREYSTRGVLVDLSGGIAYSSQAKTDNYALTKIDIRGLYATSPRLTTAARVYAANVYGADVPFYERQSLGGSYLMRGFILDRFVDNGAWTIELEERITAKILRIEGSEVHFRIDPFLTIGQVYNRWPDLFDRIQFTQGIGIRAYTPPNVVGRIDIAHEDKKINVYVELGYPF